MFNYAIESPSFPDSMKQFVQPDLVADWIDRARS